MKKLAFCIVILLLSKSFATVVQGNFKKITSLKYGIVFEPHIRDAGQSILSSALTLTQATIQDKVALSVSKDDKFDFIIQVTDRKTLAIQDSDNESLSKFTNNLKGDAYSIFLSDKPGSPVIVRILWDEAMYLSLNDKSVERPDAFARLVTLLGHEIMGNVLSFISRRDFYESPSFRYSEKVRSDEYKKSEVRAFTAGADFLEALISKFKNTLPSKMIQDFRQALEREIDLLNAHKSNLNPEERKTVISIDSARIKSCKVIVSGN